MVNISHGQKSLTIPMFQGQSEAYRQNPTYNSSLTFETLTHPISNTALGQISVLPIILPPATLRPVAFRIFTKKHSLTLSTSALQVIATFIGRHCGTEWRESGLAEPILEEIAKSWKNRTGIVIVDGESKCLKDIFKTLEGCIISGRIVTPRELSRQNSIVSEPTNNSQINQVYTETQSNFSSANKTFPNLRQTSLDLIEKDDLESFQDPRNWLQVIDAFEQPRLVYNIGKKHFDRETKKPSLFPPASHKTQLFRNRYNLIHQRLLRNELFHKPTFDTLNHGLKHSHFGLEAPQQFYKLTQISNLLGRSGTNHLILGLLCILPTETLSIIDLTGSIALDLTHAKPIPEGGAWFTPGMIVLVDGTYIEDDDGGLKLGIPGGIGGCIGGKFIGFFVCGPPCERRSITLGLSASDHEENLTHVGEFGWVDFLGVGSERAVGSKMRKIQQKVLRQKSIEERKCGRGRIVIMGEVNLDQTTTLQALKKLFSLYASEPEEDNPMAFVLMGNFVQYAILARGDSGGSIEYKENFDRFASILSDYPALLQSSTFIFVPGDNDEWVSAFGSGASVILPQKGIPEIFTSRIKRVFTVANAEAHKKHGRKTTGKAIWTTNPARLTLFGPTNEIVLFRDDMASRLRRSAIHFSQAESEPKNIENNNLSLAISSTDSVNTLDTNYPSPDLSPKSCNQILSDDLQIIRKLVKPLLDQGYLSPFTLTQRPVHWDYASALQIYPLPTALVLADADTLGFVTTYEGCCVMNPGRLVVNTKKNTAGWVEYDTREKKSKIRELQF